MTTASSLFQGGPAGEPGRPLRLLMEPGALCDVRGRTNGYRWVTELNGHPGQCSPDHWHANEIEALDCFRGELPISEPELAAPATTRRAR